MMVVVVVSVGVPNQGWLCVHLESQNSTTLRPRPPALGTGVVRVIG
jgi:hypothetical protein